MKKVNVILGAVIEFVKNGGISTGVVADKGIYQAAVDVVNDLGEVLTIQVPYKDLF
jgi:hypothetical protein